MRTALIIIVLCIYFSTSRAQMWCTPGSEWSYNSAHALYDATITQTYLYDTIVNSVSFNKLRTIKKVQNGQEFSTYIYTSLQNDVVYMNGSNETLPIALDTFIYFGPIGARWHCHTNIYTYQPVGYHSCRNSFIEITDTGHINYQGQRLKFRKINYTNYYAYGEPQQVTQTGVDTIFERVGYKHISYLYTHCHYIPLAIADQAIFNCFQDNQIFMNDTSVCDFYVGIKDKSSISENRITIYPNPAKKQFVLDLKNTTVAMPLTISIKDLFGKEFIHWEEKAYNDKITIPVTGLLNGLYLLQVIQNGKVFSTKLIIEDE